MLRIIVFIKINIFSRRFCECSLSTAEKEVFEKKKEKARRRGRERGKKGKEGGGERHSWY